MVTHLQLLRQKLNQYQPTTVAENMPRAAVLVAFTRHGKDPELILTKRSAHLSTYPGQVAFPGGRQDITDASIEQTALRESQEEIGLESRQVELLGRLDEEISLYNIKVTPIIALVPTTVALSANPDELDSLFKVPLSFFKQAHLFKQGSKVANQSVQKVSPTLPSFRYKGYLIWGLTARIIVRLMAVVYDQYL